LDSQNCGHLAFYAEFYLTPLQQWHFPHRFHNGSFFWRKMAYSIFHPSTSVAFSLAKKLGFVSFFLGDWIFFYDPAK
jgi:hypothetical protein